MRKAKVTDGSLPSGWEWGALETRPLTIAYWLAVAAFALAYWLTPLPPGIDYPQHLALGALIRRLLDPASPERLVYEVSPITYNGLFHFLTAALSWLVPPEVAGKLLLSGIVLLTGTAFLAVVRVGNRPGWYAFLLLPFCFSHISGWGFVNYTLGVPLALLVFCWWVRWRDGQPRLWPRIMVGALLLAYAHVLAMVCLCLTVAVTALSYRTPREQGLGRWTQFTGISLWPLVPAVVWSVLVFLHHRVAPHIYWEPEKDGTDIPAFQKLRYLSAFSVNNLSDHSDELLFWSATAVLAALWLSPLFIRPGAPPRRELTVLAVAWGLLYLTVPRVLMSTWYIFERIPVFWFTFLAAAAPTVPDRFDRWLRTIAVSVGITAGLNTAHALHRIPDAQDASAIIDDIPPTAKVVAVMHGQGAEPALWRQVWVHLLAYHLVRHPGQIAFDFTRYASLPVRRRDAAAPPLFRSGLEWAPAAYDPTEEYARVYHLVLVRTPDDRPHEDPRDLTFGASAQGVRLLARRG
ncbi:hypothetical protein ACFL5O_02165, partial [Myxococcota bacterium]